MNCGGCKHWGKNKNDSAQDFMRFCHMIMNNLRPNSIKIGADDDYNLQCHTHKYFGCKLFEGK